MCWFIIKTNVDNEQNILVDTDRFRNEAAIFRKYIKKIENEYGYGCKVQGIQEKDGNGEMSKAWRIVLNPAENNSVVPLVGIFDWDDTLEAYTSRKDKFYKELEETLPAEIRSKTPDFIKMCQAVNEAARVLPENGVHPEHYSPRLELVALSVIVDGLKAGKNLNLVESITQETDKGSDEVAARQFIANDILPMLKDSVGVKLETNKNGMEKKYFIEIVNQSVSIDPEQQPRQVGDVVWNLYGKSMMEANIGDGDFANFDLPQETRFIVATFGEASFQLEKITNGIKALKSHNARTPDEILIFLRGRKEPVIRKVCSSYPNAKFVYVDDSPRQVEKAAGIDGITVVQAVRKGSKRSAERAGGNVRLVDMATTKMSEILSRNL